MTLHRTRLRSLLLCLPLIFTGLLFTDDFSFVDATGNNHDATELQEVIPENADEIQEAGGDDDAGFKRKEQSILQAKLTKLAIQIGYAGKQMCQSRRIFLLRDLVFESE